MARCLMGKSRNPSPRAQEIEQLRQERLTHVPGGNHGSLVQYDGYEIYYLTPYTNIAIGSREEAECLVSLSGGIPSSEAGIRAMKRWNTAFWFADTLWEDPDLYRFLHDYMRMIGGRLYWYTDGRIPTEIQELAQFIPNSLTAACSYQLK